MLGSYSSGEMDCGHQAAVAALICFVLIRSHASPPAEDYWRSVWPNTPMPKALRALSQPGIWMEGNKLELHDFLVNNGTATEFNVPRGPKAPLNFTTFFFEQDLQPGRKKNFLLLPPNLINQKPFYAYRANSTADKSTNPLELCENPSTKAEDKFCATSLESLINFSISLLGKNVRVLSTEIEKKTQKQQRYKIVERVQKVGDKAVVCHKLPHRYAVFYCHDDHDTSAYTVPLKGADGTKVKLLAVCHANTSKWNPNHLAFQVLKVKPGTVPVCHFLAPGTLLWIPN